MTIAHYFAAALIVCGLAGAASAQNALAPGQEPPPVADKGTTVQIACIGENDGYVMRGKQPMFVVTLENKCEQRMTCKVFVYINSAKGPSQGRGTIVLAGKSHAEAAKKTKNTFAMKAKMNGGSSQSTRECRVM